MDGKSVAVFPGRTTNLNVRDRPVLEIWLVTNSDNDTQRVQEKAFQLAIEEVNQENIIDNFVLSGKTVDEMEIDIELIKENQTVGIVGPQKTQTVDALINTIAMISYKITDDKLSFTSKCPTFIRTIEPDSQQAAAVGQLLQVLQ